jgi:hypothetical protein
MAQQGWHLKHGSASWGVGTHGFIEFSAVASNSDSSNNLGEMPMHLEGILPGRISHSSLEQEILSKRAQIFM